MTPQDRRLWIDLRAADYLEALESQDFDAQVRLWAIAAQDAELEEGFEEIHQALLEEQAAEAQSQIQDAVVKHLTSASILAPHTGPVTVAMVAEELFHKTPARLSSRAHALNERLRSTLEELPADLAIHPLTAWMEQHFGPVDSEYVLEFRKAAQKVRMRANSDAEHVLAARRQKRPSEGPT